MWNTDPVIVVAALAFYGAWITAYSALQAAKLRKLWKLCARSEAQTAEALRLLKIATKNDHRDTEGRYASLEDVCIPPGNYPANR